jgi:hypothetical protein
VAAVAQRRSCGGSCAAVAAAAPRQCSGSGSGSDSGAWCGSSGAAAVAAAQGAAAAAQWQEGSDVEIAEDLVARREYVGRRLFRGIIAHGSGDGRKPTINQMDYTAPPKTPCQQCCNTKQCSTNNAPSTNAPSMTLIKNEKNESAWGVVGQCCWYQKSLANKCAMTKESCNLKKGSIFSWYNIKWIILIYFITLLIFDT